VDLILMAAIGGGIRLLALGMMYKISNPKIMNLVAPEEAQTLKIMHNADKLEVNNEQDNPGSKLESTHKFGNAIRVEK
jgi:hypothetical protein